MFYRIISSEDTEDEIYIYSKDNIKGEDITVSSGGRSCRARLESKTNMKKNEVVISSNLLEELLIPENLEYQISFNEGEMRIGPVIGLLVFKSKRRLTSGGLRKLNSYTNIYQEIRGLLVALSVDNIDLENKCVQGYYYNPEGENKKGAWKKGIFPMPDSIFQRTLLTETMRASLKEETKNCLFNSNYFNKWEFWQLISKYGPCSKNLPYTRLYSNFEDVDYIIENYGSAYLKPLNGTLSRGLYKVTLEGSNYRFLDKQGEEVASLNTKEESEEFIRNTMGRHRYLVQQGINPLRVKGRYMDFRVIMQKDDTMNWSCTGIIALIGARGDICTNWGCTSTFDDILYKAFNFSQKDIFKKKREVIAACKCVCEMLDETGENYGDLGFDVMIDEQLNVWVLEANKRHYHTVPLWVNDVQTFYNTKSNPIKYAAAIAGFKVYK